MSLWKRKEIQKMSWCGRLKRLFIVAALAALTSAVALAQANDDALWREFGLVEKTTVKLGKAPATLYRMKDLTGAVAAWEWQRGVKAKPCALEAFCSTDGRQSVVASANFLLAVDATVPKAALDEFFLALPNRHDTSLPAILNYVPRKNLVPNSARYVLGPASFKNFAAPITVIDPGFDQGAEAQIADYKMAAGNPIHLAVFYYPTPEMARLHSADFRKLPGVHVKRSSVLVAVVFGGAPDPLATSLLNQIEYEARITWNDIPPPSPIKPLYQLLWNIIYLSGVLVALCLLSGLIYAGIRLYRRKFGTLEDEEAMTTLHLSGD